MKNNFRKDQIVHLYDPHVSLPWYDGWDTLAVVISNDKKGLKIKAFENGQIINFVNGCGNGLTVADRKSVV